MVTKEMCEQTNRCGIYIREAYLDSSRSDEERPWNEEAWHSDVIRPMAQYCFWKILVGFLVVPYDPIESSGGNTVSTLM